MVELRLPCGQSPEQYECQSQPDEKYKNINLHYLGNCLGTNHLRVDLAQNETQAVIVVF